MYVRRSKSSRSSKSKPHSHLPSCQPVMSWEEDANQTLPLVAIQLFSVSTAFPLSNTFLAILHPSLIDPANPYT